MVKLWRCQICGDPYIGEEAPTNCPFCGAHQDNIKEFRDSVANYDVEMTETDRKNVETALKLELGNAAFYFCAAGKTNDEEGKKLFKALGKVEKEHADIWKKILKLDSIELGEEQCSIENKDNLQESHDREERAIDFYRKSAEEADNDRIKELFLAIVEVETDHLALSEDRLK